MVPMAITAVRQFQAAGHLICVRGIYSTDAKMRSTLSADAVTQED
jgi:hypothetical protein